MIEEKKIYEEAIKQHGKLQLVVAIEELSELQKEICKSLRGKANMEHISEEIADAEIMIEQLKLIYGNEKQISMYREQKVRRLAMRLNMEVNENESS